MQEDSIMSSWNAKGRADIDSPFTLAITTELLTLLELGDRLV